MKCSKCISRDRRHCHSAAIASQYAGPDDVTGVPVATGPWLPDRPAGGWHDNAGHWLAKLGAVVVLCGLLGACAIIPQPPEVQAGIDNPAAWAAHKAELAALQTWSIQGRAATGQLLGWVGNLSWRQQGERFDVRLSAPLGGGGFQATGTLDHVVVRTGEDTIRTTHPQRLVQRILGFRFPLRPLRYWARGLPAPGDYDSISVNAEGRLVALQQQGWELSFLEYSDQAGQPALPTRIVLDDGETRIRMVVARWFNLGRDATAAD